MNKQNVIILLMALTAVILMTIACGSSEEPTESTRNTRSADPTSEQGSQNRNSNPLGIETQTTSDSTGPKPPQAVNTPQISGTRALPWPTPVPTRPKQTEPATGAPPSTPDPTPPSTDENPENQNQGAQVDPELRAGIPAPPYDGASPLVHVFFDLPWIIIPAIEGHTYKIDLKGLTQAGDIVAIEDPSAWGITLEDASYFDREDADKALLVEPDGTLTVPSNAIPERRTTYEQIAASFNGNLSQIRIFRSTQSDELTTITDHSLLNMTAGVDHRNCTYASPHQDKYTPVFHHAAVFLVTSSPDTLETVLSEAVLKEVTKLGFDSSSEPRVPDTRLGPAPITVTYLIPPKSDCIPMETAYQLAREINKIPGVHALRWSSPLNFDRTKQARIWYAKNN